LKRGNGDAVKTEGDIEQCRREAAEAEAALNEAEMEIRRLEAEISYLQTQLKQKEDSGVTIPSAALIGKTERSEDGGNGEEADTGDMTPFSAMLADSASCSAEERELRRLRGKLAEIEAQNSALRKQLNGRPIVFQFGPEPEEELGADEDDGDGDPASDVASVEAGTAPAGPSNPTGEAPQVDARAAMWGAAKKCRRKTVRVLCIWRRQPCAKSIERSLRAFTRMLLHRPLLLWLFYAQLLALWSVEIWRQARSQPIASEDPANRIEGAFKALNAGEAGR